MKGNASGIGRREGTGFSPYINACRRAWALAAEGSLLCLAPAAALVLLLIAAIASPAAAQTDSATTLHVNVKLVNVFVNVTDKNGAIVGGLTRDDFHLAEDGRPQTISIFERQSEMPLNLTLAIDTSGSVYKDMSAEETAAKRFVHALMRPQDRMSLIEFAMDVHEITSFTNKVSQIDRGLGSLRGGPSTALYDAIYLGSQRLGTLEGRKVLVIISDGDDTAEDINYAQALEQALRNEVMIYSLIDVPIEASAGRDLRGEHALITLAEQTGGKSYYVNEGGLDKAFSQVSDDLRTQYLLGYYPKNQEPGRNFHRVQVTIPRASAQDFNIRSRAGYYADSPVKSD
jgi:Ca-activated chloride channel homolog